MTGASGRARLMTFFGSLAPMTWLTMLPRPPKGLCSSTVTTTFLPFAAASRPFASRGLTQYMSSTVADMPCAFSSAAASLAGLTISPQATIRASVPSQTTVALSISKGQLPSS